MGSLTSIADKIVSTSDLEAVTNASAELFDVSDAALSEVILITHGRVSVINTCVNDGDNSALSQDTFSVQLVNSSHVVN